MEPRKRTDKIEVNLGDIISRFYMWSCRIHIQ